MLISDLLEVITVSKTPPPYFQNLKHKTTELRGSFKTLSTDPFVLSADQRVVCQWQKPLNISHWFLKASKSFKGWYR